jgi:hypothetical protein
VAGVYVKRIFTPGTPVEQVMKAVAAMMTALPAKPFAVTVEVWKKPRTNQQNAYLWGVVYPAVIEGGGEALGGFTRDDVHEWLLGECFGWQTLEGFGRKRMRPLKRSSALNKQEFSDYLTFIDTKCAEFGIVIPEPYEG